MTSLPGGFRSDLRRPQLSQSLSSLSPLAAPFTAGGRPLAEDPMNPPHLAPTAPSFHTGTHQNVNPNPNFQIDGFKFSSGADMVCDEPFYRSYGAWKPSWAPDVSGGEESASWMDPSLNYHLSPIDKGTRSSMNFPSYEEAPINPATSHTNPLSNPYRFVLDTSDPFSTGFRSSVVGPMLKELSDSFSVASSPYDKYMYQLESCSSPNEPNQPPDPFDPCRISFNYFDYMQNEHKEPVPVQIPISGRTRVSITAPANIGNETHTKNIKVKCAGPGTSLDEFLSGTSTGDQRSDDVDSPCWKGMPSQSQQPFTEGQNGNLPSAPMPSENPNFVFTQDKKLKSVFVESGDPSEEKCKENKMASNSGLEASSLNKQESVSCEKNEKGELLGRKNDVKLLIKSMHDLSQVLLSSCGDDFELEQFESELLQSAIQNLKSFTGGNKKLSAGDFKGANSGKIYENIKAYRDSEQAINERNYQINSASKLGDNDYKKCILQAVDKLPRHDSDVQAELYKNLWLEAEVLLCTMKYELQLAKTKLKLESPDKHGQEVDSSSSLGELKSSDPIRLDQSSVKEQPKQTLEAPISEPSKPDPTEENESPKIKENTTTEEVKTDLPLQIQFKPVGTEGQNGNFSPSFEHNENVDSTVLARLRILKRREENNNLNGDNSFFPNLNGDNSFYPNYYSLGCDAWEPHNAYSSEWEHVAKDEL